MNVGEAISTCLAKYVDFKGRARRSEYWFFYLFYIIVYIAVVVATASVDPNGTIANFVVLAFFLPLLAAGVRRLHDVGKSGWFILVPIYNLILLGTQGTSGDNEYGPRPQ